MHTYFHTCILTYLHTCILAYLHSYILTYLHTYMPTYLHTYILTYWHSYIQTYRPTDLHKDTHAHTYTYTYTCTYTHTNTHTHRLRHRRTRTYTYARIHIPTCTYIHIHTYTRIHTIPTPVPIPIPVPVTVPVPYQHAYSTLHYFTLHCRSAYLSTCLPAYLPAFLPTYIHIPIPIPISHTHTHIGTLHRQMLLHLKSCPIVRINHKQTCLASSHFQVGDEWCGRCRSLSWSRFGAAWSPFETSKPCFGWVDFVLTPPLSAYLPLKTRITQQKYLNVIFRSCYPWTSASHEVQDRNDSAGLICRACESGFFSEQMMDGKGTTHVTRHCRRAFESCRWCFLRLSLRCWLAQIGTFWGGCSGDWCHPIPKYLQRMGCVVVAVEIRMLFVIMFPEIVNVHITSPFLCRTS